MRINRWNYEVLPAPFKNVVRCHETVDPDRMWHCKKEYDMLDACTVTYIYILIDPEKDKHGYVGKADDPYTRYNNHMGDVGETEKIKWLESLKARGLAPILKIIECVEEAEWSRFEQSYILQYRAAGWTLYNTKIQDKHDAEWSAHMSAKAKAKWADPEYKAARMQKMRDNGVYDGLVNRYKEFVQTEEGKRCMKEKFIKIEGALRGGFKNYYTEIKSDPKRFERYKRRMANRVGYTGAAKKIAKLWRSYGWE